MKVIGITGWKNSGKTTLVERLVEYLVSKHYKVSTIKHAHHQFDIDHPGTDSDRHRSAGASEVLVASASRWALIHESKPPVETPLTTFLEKLSPADLVVVEGFKGEDIPKIAVIRRENNADRLPLDVTNLVALASDESLDPQQYRVNGPCLNLNDIAAIGSFVIDYMGINNNR